MLTVVRNHSRVVSAWRLARFASTSAADADVIVIGGGHAGCEAASAAARCGSKTILLTHRTDTIGEMSCNPSFGGIGKGHLIREIDALDGLCARICDKSAITYQALNRGQGPAVLGLRAQIDRKLYKKHVQEEILNNIPNLTVVEGAVEDLWIGEEKGRAVMKGIILSDDRRMEARSVVITTGTFLGGELFLGLERWPSGRMGDKSSIGLPKTLQRLGLELGRLRTGTPPRLIKNTIDFSRTEVMPPDEIPIPFSLLTEDVWLSPDKQLPTYLAETNEDVRKMVEANLHENEHVTSETTGPRYCPSLESKVIRFPQLNHRMFLEHEGLDSDLIYPQGMSMTFKAEVQEKIMRCIPGLEKVQVAQPGYGVQYDFVNPRQLNESLEVKKVKGLFLAGQINGTTGYEEAASQGVLAGINAAVSARGEEEQMKIPRTQAYLGVLVDDLTSLGTNEPYRMFTSRAECRLHLRPDNADIRLTELGRRFGAVGDERWSLFLERKKSLQTVTEQLKSVEMSVAKWNRLLPNVNKAKQNAKVLSAFEMIHRHNVSFSDLSNAMPDVFGSLGSHSKKLEEQIRIEGSYAVMHQRMQAKMVEIDRESSTRIPDDADYSLMQGLSMECAEKLERMRPGTLAAASRIPGITPEAIVVLLRYLKKAQVMERASEGILP